MEPSVDEDLHFNTEEALPELPSVWSGKVIPMCVYGRVVVCMHMEGNKRAEYLPGLSSKAVKAMNVLLDMGNASVNYMAAFAPYVTALVSHARNKVVSMPPMSVPVTGAVCQVMVKDGGVQYVKRDGFPAVSYATIPRLSGIKFNTIDTRLSSGIHKSLSRPFPSLVDYKAFLWIVGNCMMDPPAPQKFVLLYGTGSNGKSTLLGAITSCLGTFAAGALSDQAVCGGASSSRVQDNLISTLSEHMLCVVADLELSNKSSDKLDIHLVKIASGGDTIQCHGVDMEINTTIVCGANTLADPVSVPGWGGVALSRRMVTLACTTRFDQHTDKAPPTNSDSVKSDIFSMCMAIRASKKYMPAISIMSLLMTLCGSRYETASNMLEECDNASPCEEYEATLLLSFLMLTSTDTVVPMV